MSDDSPPSDSDWTPTDPPRNHDVERGGDAVRDEPERVPLVDVSETWLLRAAVALAVLLLLYSVLVVQRLLLWVAAVTPFVLLYLLWRFVRAHERLAAAQERRARE